MTNCLIKNVTRSMIKKGSLTHNVCYRIRAPEKGVQYESTIKKRIYRSYLFKI